MFIVKHKLLWLFCAFCTFAYWLEVLTQLRPSVGCACISKVCACSQLSALLHLTSLPVTHTPDKSSHLDDSFAHSWHFLNQLNLECFSNSLERMPRVCEDVIKAKCGYFEESKIYFDLFKTVLVTTWFHMFYFIVLRSSLLFYNVENSQK